MFQFLFNLLFRNFTYSTDLAETIESLMEYIEQEKVTAVSEAVSGYRETYAETVSKTNSMMHDVLVNVVLQDEVIMAELLATRKIYAIKRLREIVGPGPSIALCKFAVEDPRVESVLNNQRDIATLREKLLANPIEYRQYPDCEQ